MSTEERRVRCNECMSIFDESRIVKYENFNGEEIEACPVCSKTYALMDFE